MHEVQHLQPQMDSSPLSKLTFPKLEYCVLCHCTESTISTRYCKQSARCRHQIKNLHAVIAQRTLQSESIFRTGGRGEAPEAHLFVGAWVPVQFALGDVLQRLQRLQQRLTQRLAAQHAVALEHAAHRRRPHAVGGALVAPVAELLYTSSTLHSNDGCRTKDNTDPCEPISSKLVLHFFLVYFCR